MKTQTNIAVIGMGPRGVTVLERLHAVLGQDGYHADTHLHIFTDGDVGTGVHKIEQPDYLLVNTVACQITMYTDSTVKNAGPVSEGPSFYEWAVNEGYKIKEDGTMSKTEGRDVQPNDYLPRALFGKYLNWVSYDIIDKLRRVCQVTIHHQRIEKMTKITTGRFVLKLDSKVNLMADYVYLTTGHSTNVLNPRETDLIEKANALQNINPKMEFIADPYPIAKVAEKVDSDTTLAIEGFGLTAFDLIGAATVAKGGRFVKTGENGRMKYIKSGNEPKLIVYSLDGLPLAGRAVNQKGTSVQYKAKFLTREKIDFLRGKYWGGKVRQLDFEANILPELLKDMQYVYYTTLLKETKSDSASRRFGQKYLQKAHDVTEIQKLVARIPKEQRFDWQKMLNPTLGQRFDSPKAYRDWMINYLNEDLDECLKGNVKGAYKAACDVLRDVRDNIRYAIDFGGLTEQSHKAFLQKYMPIMNRLSVGPPKERIAEILALIDAKVIDVFVGENPKLSVNESLGKFDLVGSNVRGARKRHIDIIVKARIAAPLPEQDESPLMQSNLRSGLVRPFMNGSFHPGGIEVDGNFHPINVKGRPVKNMWAIGTVAEGAKFYTYIVPRAGVNSTGLVDAGRSVLDMHAQMQKAESKREIKIAQIAHMRSRERAREAKKAKAEATRHATVRL